MHTSKKRAQGMPLNVIIIAVILLIVLVLVVVVFKSNFFKFSEDIQSCSIKGGNWLSITECNSKGGRVLEGIEYKDEKGNADKNKKCCLVVII